MLELSVFPVDEASAGTREARMLPSPSGAVTALGVSGAVRGIDNAWCGAYAPGMARQLRVQYPAMIDAPVNAAGDGESPRCEPGPLAARFRETEPRAQANPFRFSTQYQDEESDLLDDGYEQALKLLNSRHDLLVFSVIDPREQQLPEEGLFEIEDAETGELLLIDCGDPGFRRRFAEQAKRRKRQQNDLFKRMGIDLAQVELKSDFRELLDPVVSYFRRRAKKRV